MTEIAPDSRPPARWLVSFAALGVPQAAAPIAFSLVALSLTGSAAKGAAMVLGMMVSQVIGAVPVTRLGGRLDPSIYVRALIAVKAAGLAAIAVFAELDAPFFLLVLAAAVTGSVDGAAFGYLRSMLNGLVSPDRLPRALGMAATATEIVFVLAPVAAAGAGAISPVFAVLAMSASVLLSFCLTPSVPDFERPAATGRGSSILAPPILLWFFCAVAGTSAVAGIEIGTVSLAIGFGLQPAEGFIFPLALCVASVCGGVWVSVRSRMPRRLTVIAYLVVTTVGAGVIASRFSVPTTLLGAVMIGAVLAPLATFYSLIFDRLTSADRRAEAFALLRIAMSVGVIITSGMLALTTLTTSLIGSTILMCIATCAAATTLAVQGDRP